MSGNRCLRRIFLGLILSATAACSTAPPSIFEPFSFDRGNSLSTDAGQRVIINMKTHASSHPGRVNPERIICAEPSPDVASAVASSLGFGLNILGKANTAISSAQGTALAQLAERTITVQLLRDQMYQACQAYSNGAISGTEYSLLMSRNNDAMVTLMLGESAARLVGRDLATASVDGRAEATASMPDVMKALEEVETTQEQAENANNAAIGAAKTKAATDTAVQATGDNSSNAATSNAADNAETATETQEDTENRANQTNEEVKEAIKEAVKVVTEASTSANTSAGGFKSGALTLNEHAVGVAEQLVELQENYFGQGSAAHFIAACTVELGNNRKFFSIKPDSKDGSNLILTDDRRNAQPTYAQARFSMDEMFDAVATAATQAVAIESNAPGDAQAASKELTDQISKAKTEAEKAEVIRTLGISEIGIGLGDLSSHSLEIAINAYQAAQEKEQDKGFLGIFGRRRSISQDRLRTMVALENAKKASALSEICHQLLADELTKDRKSLHSKDLFNFMIDLERERAKRYKSAKAGTSIRTTPKPDLKDIPALVADYVMCDTEAGENETKAKVEACRIRVLAQIVDERSGSGNSGRTSNRSGGIVYDETLAGPFIALIAIYDTKEKADENWPLIEKDLGADLLKDKKKQLKTVKSDGEDKLSLRLGSFENEAAANTFCTQVKAKFKEKGRPGDCQPTEQ